MSEVKWPWALNKNGEQVKIDSVKKNEIEEYRCIICGEKVIPKLGDKNKHHFCHYGKINPSIDHSPESYLHKTFKNTLYSLLDGKIKKDEKFIVQWKVSNLGLKKTNILRNQAEIKIEEPLSNEENHKLWEFIKDLPPVRPTQRKGKWENKGINGHYFYGKCSKCGQEFCVDTWYTQNMKYCPNCGAEMR